MSLLNFKYIPLTFISNRDEIKKLIRNSIILIYLFEKYKSSCRLEKIIEGTQYGYNASALQSGKNKFLRISDIHESNVNWDSVPFCNCNDEATYSLEKDDILIARTGGTTGKSFKIEVPPPHSIYAGYLIRIRAKKDVDPDFIYLFLNSYVYWSQIVNLNERNFRPKANAENLKALILPDCPLDVQKDMVKIGQGVKLDGYEELFDRIDEVLTECDRVRQLQDLLSSQLTLLTQLNQAILQEAVQGQLVPQDPQDEPASVLLQRIKAEKEKLGKKEKALPPIKKEEVPFEVPEGWVWCRLGEICTKITDGTHHSPVNTNTGDFKYVTAKNIKSEGIDISNITYVTKEVHKEIFSRCDPEFGDVLYIKDGATTGVATLNNISEQFSMLSSVALLKVAKKINNQYVVFAMRSPFFYNQTRDGMYGVAITRVTLQKINNLLIPLPPLAEQARIVTAIEQQLAKTAALKEQVLANQAATEQLLQALLQEAFEVEAV